MEKYLRKHLLGLQPYSSAREEFSLDSSNYLMLDANENPFDTDYNRYPDPYQKELKQVVANLKNIPTSNICFGNGSDEILDLLMRMFCEVNQEMIIFPPTYGMYEVCANINQVKVVKSWLLSNFQPNAEDFWNKVTPQTKMVIFCQPNNPTGNLIREDFIFEVLEKFNGIVVIDEAYGDFASTESWQKKVNLYPNIVVMQTLSKAYGLAGLRLGMAIANKETIGWMHKVKAPYNVNTVSAKIATNQLKNYDATVWKTIIKEREKLIESFQEIPWITKIYPTEANFILIEADDANLRYQQLLQHQIVIRKPNLKPLVSEALRITVGTPEQNDRLLKAMRALVISDK
jgi:histidinol-phosphate aminotransferase